MGTARTGTADDGSLVDDTGRLHGIDNLIVADSSVFASAAAVNPTPTLQAFALRAADALRRRMGLPVEAAA